MDESGDYHTKCSKSEKVKHPMRSLMCGILKKKDKKYIFTKWKQTQTSKTNL